MDGSVVQTWMSDILHAVTQGLLVPDILLLVLFMGYALFCIGSIISEFFTERKHFKAEMPRFLAALMAAEENEIPTVIEQSGLLKRQKVALLTVYDYRMLPGDALIALIKRLVSEEESRYDRISGRNNMAARVSPMLGLMGTLIPLGPGIQALGSANTEMLSASLLIAFDTTVAGLVTAAVCMVIGKIRSIWYGNYMSALDSAMATMLQKIEDMRAEGKIVIKEPSDYAFLFEQVGSNKSDEKSEGKQPEWRTAKKSEKKNEKKSEAKSDKKSDTGQSVDAKIAPAAKPTPISTPANQTAPQTAAAKQPDVVAGSAPTEGFAAGFQPKFNAEMPVDPLINPGVNPSVNPSINPSVSSSINPTPFSQAPSTTPANPLDSLAYEPAKTYGYNASFAPVPDPTFISDLAAASAANPAPVPASAANPVPTTPSEFSLPFDPSQGRQSSGWYQPRLRTDDKPAQPYPQNGGYPTDVPYQNR